MATDRSSRRPDRLGGLLGGSFVLLLLGTEVVLTLPDETDPPAAVAAFYLQHRAAVVILQILGIVAAGLLGGYAWRLRRVDRVVSVTGIVLACCSLVPGLITLVTALVADPAAPAAAAGWNRLEPRADDLLFLAIVVFAAAVAIRLGPRTPLLAVLAVIVVLACAGRLILEASGLTRGPLDAAAPLSFLLLLTVMAIFSWLGILRPSLKP